MATEKRLKDVSLFEKTLEKHRGLVMHNEDIFAALANCPTVDAGEVVRCKECMFCRGVESTENRALECSNPLGLPIITPDTYCAYGERREKP